MKKTGIALIILAVIIHFLAVDWKSDLTIATPDVRGFFWGILVPPLIIFIGYIAYGMRPPHFIRVLRELFTPVSYGSPPRRRVEAHPRHWPRPEPPMAQSLSADVRVKPVGTYGFPPQDAIPGSIDGGVDGLEITGRYIRNLRTRKNFSRKELASRLGVSVSTIRRWESSPEKLLPASRFKSIRNLEGFPPFFPPPPPNRIAE